MWVEGMIRVTGNCMCEAYNGFVVQVTEVWHGEWMIWEAVCVILVSLFLLVVESMFMKQGEQYSKMASVMLLYGSNKSSQITESRLRPFVYISKVLVKCSFVVHSEAEVPGVTDLFHCFVTDGGGNQPSQGSVCYVNEQFLCFVHV